MRFDVITIFPEFFGSVFDHGIIRRAKSSGLVEILAHDLRQWATDKHRMVDDRPFGGGDGMVLKPEPIFNAVEALTNAGKQSRVVLMSPQGRSLDQSLVKELAGYEQLVIICGRYEGVDERVAQRLATDEISIGDYVLSGGEPAALVLIDAIVRLLPGALGSDTSVLNESFSNGLLDCPQYTRPPEFRGMKVPEVLLSGNHAEIEKWRRKEACEKTRCNRPDLLEE
ncbi:MAG: tRNA (guanosine(37)-N1)-methyltransferase TrmD [Pyrinomonadaceae bacterium]